MYLGEKRGPDRLEFDLSGLDKGGDLVGLLVGEMVKK